MIRTGRAARRMWFFTCWHVRSSTRRPFTATTCEPRRTMPDWIAYGRPVARPLMCVTTRHVVPCASPNLTVGKHHQATPIAANTISEDKHAVQATRRTNLEAGRIQTRQCAPTEQRAPSCRPAPRRQTCLATRGCPCVRAVQAWGCCCRRSQRQRHGGAMRGLLIRSTPCGPCCARVCHPRNPLRPCPA